MLFSIKILRIDAGIVPFRGAIWDGFSGPLLAQSIKKAVYLKADKHFFNAN